MARLALILCAVALSSCAAAPVQVAVPVARRVELPADLLAPILPPGPVFSAPGGASAVACLDAAGKDQFVGYVDLLRQRVGAWAAWSAP